MNSDFMKGVLVSFLGTVLGVPTVLCLVGDDDPVEEIEPEQTPREQCVERCFPHPMYGEFDNYYAVQRRLGDGLCVCDTSLDIIPLESFP